MSGMWLEVGHQRQKLLTVPKGMRSDQPRAEHAHCLPRVFTSDVNTGQSEIREDARGCCSAVKRAKKRVNTGTLGLNVKG